MSLTNVDYKVHTKTIAIRTENILPKIIQEDQDGFVKGRYMGENIRLIDDIIYNCNKNYRTYLLLKLDFEKTFDSIQWSYLANVLVKFNVGETFCKWV